ncbi:AbfB domain-containing protein [Micromonospora sp. ATA51]|nr:AbfB domain-containing protein [Micromonospora sp. ATA51]
MHMFRSPTRRVRGRTLASRAAIALTMIGATFAVAPSAQAAQPEPPARPQGPCDIYAAGGTPCVAAHSTTRAMYASYDGPLYQVRRLSDDAVKDIGIVQPVARPFPDAGGYADAAAQDQFCADTTCFITKLYDQSPMHNDLTQAPRGGFSGPAMGGFNNLPIADMAPITIGGHKAYGIFIEPGMGLRNNDTKGVAVDDQPEGQYWVINGHHYNNGCCYDYGNAEIDSRDDGNGTMETTYYGNATAWYRGSGPGPWIMTDQENNLVGCVNPGSTSKLCSDLPSINWRFVTAMAKGEPHHWASLGGDAQQGSLSTMFDGPRIDSSYDPMRKQGAILLGNGGDNSVGSQGTFYEGAMTTGYPSDAVDQQIQANVVATKYDVQRLSIAPASAVATPPGLQTFVPGSSQDTTVTFTNTTGSPAVGVKLSISLPNKQWTSVVPGTTDTSVTFEDPVAPGATVSATFKVTSGPAPFNGDLIGKAWWTNPTKGGRQFETTAEKVRNVSPIKINEFRTGSNGNSTNAFIELYNAGATDVDISNWTLTEHPTQQATFSTVTVPAGTTLASHSFYVLGLANSGLAAPAAAGDATINVRSTTGLAAGRQIAIDTGSSVENRTIVSVGTAATASTTLWQPVPDGPVITVPAGSTNVPVTSTTGFTVGQKIGLGYGADHEVATVTAVGRPGTQGRLSAAARAGATNIKMSSTANISVGDKIRLDIDSPGHGIDNVTVTAVGTSGANGTGITIAAPLQFDHASNLPYSVWGTGVSFTPATRFPHSSNEPVQALGSGVTLDKPLDNGHAVNTPVRDTAVTNAGYQGTTAPNQWFGGPALATAGNMVLRDAQDLVVDSLNYGTMVDPWTAEGYQATSGAGQSGCRVTNPGTTGANGRSAARFPDGNDTDSNCGDFQTASGPTPGASNDVSFTLSPGPRVSLQTTTPSGSSNYMQHSSTTTSVVTAAVTAASSTADKQNATFVKAAGLANPNCFSFEAVNRPGNYLRHQGFVVSLQPDDGSTLFSQDATFCQVAGNSGQGVSFQSVNYSTRYLRAYNGGVYLAGPPGTNEWDTSVSYADDTSWLAASPWAPAP